LNHDPTADLNELSARRPLVAFRANRTSTSRQTRLDRSKMTLIRHVIMSPVGAAIDHLVAAPISDLGLMVFQ
jgi:hypothetical protein